MIDSTDSRHPVNDLFTQYNKTIFLERMMKLLCDAWTGLFLLESFLIRRFTNRSEYTDSYFVAGGRDAIWLTQFRFSSESGSPDGLRLIM